MTGPARLTGAPFVWHGPAVGAVPLLLTCPHSGEAIPPEAGWLDAIAPLTLLTDVDRFVDRLYRPGAETTGLPLLCTRVHRYAADLNRYPDDVDAESVEGSPNTPGAFTKGFHWVRTTQGAPILARAIPAAAHAEIARRYHDAFHAEIAARVAAIRARFPGRPVFHLDLHSMPSVGTGAHADAGRRRPEVCLSDLRGKSASPAFLERTRAALAAEGFEVSLNEPYQGGRITQRYGRPTEGHETLQIELNRALYMSETTREPLPGFDAVAARLGRVLARVAGGLGA